MCSRTVAVSTDCSRGLCARASAVPGSHNGHRNAALPIPTASIGSTLSHENMSSLLTQYEFRPPGEGDERDSDGGSDRQQPLHAAPDRWRGAWLTRLACLSFLAADRDKSKHQKQR